MEEKLKKAIEINRELENTLNTGFLGKLTHQITYEISEEFILLNLILFDLVTTEGGIKIIHKIESTELFHMGGIVIDENRILNEDEKGAYQITIQFN